jgi:uncharacterized protein YeaO (DUF488 family)
VAIRVVRLGTPRSPGEGPRFGTVRRPPRGVKKEEFATRDYFDLWLPDLAPTQELVSWAQASPWTDARWATFARKYRAEMRRPEPVRLVDALALLSKQADFSVGCYCEDETRCHRAVLRDLLIEAGADVR